MPGNCGCLFKIFITEKIKTYTTYNTVFDFSFKFMPNPFDLET